MSTRPKSIISPSGCPVWEEAWISFIATYTICTHQDFYFNFAHDCIQPVHLGYVSRRLCSRSAISTAVSRAIKSFGQDLKLCVLVISWSHLTR